MACGVEFERNQKTLSDWVKDFRMKKIQMKRRLRKGGADLRVCAILSTALKSAEKELRQKQQERFVRWSELQTKLIQAQCYSSGKKDMEMEGEECGGRREVKEVSSSLWKHEIDSLDEFMRNVSSNTRYTVAAS